MQVVGTVGQKLEEMPTGNSVRHDHLRLRKGADQTRQAALTNSITSGSFSSYYTIASVMTALGPMTVKKQLMPPDVLLRKRTYSISVDANATYLPPLTKVQGSAYVKSSNYRRVQPEYNVPGERYCNRQRIFSGAAERKYDSKCGTIRQIKTGTVPAGTNILH